MLCISHLLNFLVVGLGRLSLLLALQVLACFLCRLPLPCLPLACRYRHLTRPLRSITALATTFFGITTFSIFSGSLRGCGIAVATRGGQLYIRGKRRRIYFVVSLLQLCASTFWDKSSKVACCLCSLLLGVL